MNLMQLTYSLKLFEKIMHLIIGTVAPFWAYQFRTNRTRALKFYVTML
jgi:hypothetical protein